MWKFGLGPQNYLAQVFVDAVDPHFVLITVLITTLGRQGPLAKKKSGEALLFDQCSLRRRPRDGAHPTSIVFLFQTSKWSSGRYRGSRDESVDWQKV